MEKSVQISPFLALLDFSAPQFFYDYMYIARPHYAAGMIYV